MPLNIPLDIAKSGGGAKAKSDANRNKKNPPNGDYQNIGLSSF